MATYHFEVEVYDRVWIENSAQGMVTLFKENKEIVDYIHWNDWCELPYKMRELMKKNKMKIEICDRKNNVIGNKYTKIGRKRVF